MNLAQALTLLEDAHLIRATFESESELLFQHTLTQESAYQSLLHKRRRELHESVAECIEALYPDRLDEFAARLAQHYAEAGNDAKAIVFATRAGDTARRVYAYAEALTFYSQALALARESHADPNTIRELFLKRGRAFEVASQYENALENYSQLEQWAHAQGDNEAELDALAAQATIRSIPSRVQNTRLATELSDRALTLARAIHNQAAEAKILWALMLLNSRVDVNLEQAIGYGERSLALARALNLQDQVAYTLNDLSTIYVFAGERERGMEALYQARAYWQATGNQAMVTDNFGYAVMNHLALGEFDRAITASQEAYAISERTDNAWGLAFSKMWVGQAYFERGEIAHALTAMEQALAFAARSSFAGPLVLANKDRAVLYAELGALDRAYQCVEQARASLHGTGFTMGEIWANGAHALVEYFRGNFENAAQDIERIAQELDPEPSLPWSTIFYFVEVRLAYTRGDYHKAETIAEKIIAQLLARQLAQDLPQMLTLLADSLLAQNKTDEARAKLIQAQQIAETTGARWRLWQIYARLGQIESQDAQAERANELRQRARELLAQIADDSPADLRAALMRLPDAQKVTRDQ